MKFTILIKAKESSQETYLKLLLAKKFMSAKSEN